MGELSQERVRMWLSHNHRGRVMSPFVANVSKPSKYNSIFNLG